MIVTVPRLRRLLEGVDWRGQKGIPLDTVNAVIKRLQSREGFTLEEAYRRLRVTESWVRERIKDGTVRVARAKWDSRRIYITKEMFERLRRVKGKPIKREKFTENWIFLSQASREAAVSTATIIKWADSGRIRRRKSHLGLRYQRRQVRTCARHYWKHPKFRRAVPPAWLQEKGRIHV